MEFKYLLATQSWQFDQKMSLKVLAVAFFMVRGILLKRAHDFSNNELFSFSGNTLTNFEITF